MRVISAFLFALRLRMVSFPRYKWLLIGLITLLLLGLAIFLVPTAYNENWFDPFSTLNIPNYTLHPHAFDRIGLIDERDPFHPRFVQNKELTQRLMKQLQKAKPNSTLAAAKSDEILHFVLHRPASRFHSSLDYVLEYDVKNNVIYFGGQTFSIDEATILLLNELPGKMQAGWW